MPRDGSGNFNLPAGQPVSTGTTISSTVHNALAADVAAGLTQSLSKDGQTTPTSNLPLGGFKFTGVADGTASNHFATVGQLQSAAVSLAGSVSGTDTITANLNPAITSYTSGLFVSFIVANTNATTTPTLALNGLSAKTIVRPGGQPLAVGDLVTTKLAHLQYDGTNFVLLSPATGTYPALIPTGSTVPANGVYLPAANTVGIASNTTLRASVNSTGSWTFAAPSSGNTLNLASNSGAYAVYASPDGGTTQGGLVATSGSGIRLYTGTAHAVLLSTAGNDRLTVGPAGNVTINAPSSGTTLSLVNTGASVLLGFSDGTRTGTIQTNATDVRFGSTSAHGLDFFTNSSSRFSISSAGNVLVNAPSSGTALTVSGVASSEVARLNKPDDGTIATFLRTGSNSTNLQISVVDASAVTLDVQGSSARALIVRTGGADRITAGASGNVTINAPSSGVNLATFLSGTGDIITARNSGNAFQLSLGTTATAVYLDAGNATNGLALTTQGSSNVRVAIGNSGNVTINAPSSGIPLTITAPSAGTPLSMTDGTVTGRFDFGGRLQLGSLSNHAFSLYSNNTTRLDIGASGNVTIAAPSSGVALAVSGVSGSHSATIADSAGTGGFKVGYLSIPQNAQTANYTLVLADAGKHIYHAAGAGAGDTYTIPANASVAYEIGTAITFINRDTTNAVSIAITTDTLTLAGAGTTGTRTLAAYGIATAIKVTATEWMISGTGLT
jgi:hypothetical protein